MTLTIRARQEVVRELTDMVKDYVMEDMIPYDRLDKFKLRLVIGHKGCWGGVKNGQPNMQLSVSDRYFDKAATIKKLQGQTYLAESRQSVWRKAYNHALANRWMHVEYASIANDPEIGAFISDNYEDHVTATVCHEFAHVVDLFNYYHDASGIARPKPHGSTWRARYRELRNEFSNEWIK